MTGNRLSNLALALCLLAMAVPAAGGAQRDRVIRVSSVELRYTGHVSGKAFRRHYPRTVWSSLYTAVWVRRARAPAHLLRADPEYGYFVAKADPTVSADGAYIVLELLQGGVATDGERSWWHEVSSCTFVNTGNAQVLTQETGEMCDGEFAAPNKWVSGNGSELNLAELAK